MKIMKHRPVITGRPVLVLALLLIGAMSCLQAQNIKESDIEVVYLPSGSFTMGCTYEQGSDCSYDEKPSHQVRLGAYAIAKYEVTQKLWKAVMGNNPSRVQGDDLPVHNVTWEEVQTFIARLNQMTGMNYRLPTEAEWEYAARGAAQTMSYQFSGNAELDKVGWYSENSGSQVHPVGRKQPNALGLYDMSGNVWEWCNDVYGFYSDQDQENPQGPEKGVSRVTRGGCYAALAKMCRTTARKSLYQGGSDNATGFRLAFTDDREARAAEEAAQHMKQKRKNDENTAELHVEQKQIETLSTIQETKFQTPINNILDTNCLETIGGVYLLLCQDFQKECTREEADKACPPKYRMPTKDEFQDICKILKKTKKSNIVFDQWEYWTSSNNNIGEPLSITINDGKIYRNDETDTHYVRCIKIDNFMNKNK